MTPSEGEAELFCLAGGMHQVNKDRASTHSLVLRFNACCFLLPTERTSPDLFMLAHHLGKLFLSFP